MFEKFFASLNAGNNNEPESIRRSHPRREMDQCVTVINGNIYPVQNWSMGGVLIRADDRLFGVNDEIAMTIKFKLNDRVTDVTHVGRVLRKNAGQVAFQFAPLTRKTRNDFQHVVNDYATSQFADSHSA